MRRGRKAGEPRSPATAAGTWPPGRRADPGDDGGGATAVGTVEFSGLVNADANPVGDGLGHGGTLRKGMV